MKNKTKEYQFIGLEETLHEIRSASFKKSHNNRTLDEAYLELKKNIYETQNNVVLGAMKDGIDQCIKNIKDKIEAFHSKDCQTSSDDIATLLDSSIVFLNDHGPEHVDKVIERANLIVSNFNINTLSEFEIFILLCAIQIHDVGNILGRSGHEKNARDIFDKACSNIILDGPEKRVIQSIAMAHGGKNLSGSRDTISGLPPNEPLYGFQIRTRLLASILRFSDELADDSSRANRVALDLNILGVDSLIFHCYSKALHTVTLEKDNENGDYKVVLVFELEVDGLKQLYDYCGSKKYIIDEIYNRTIKMELERRYCMKFIYPYLNIGRLDIRINIYGGQQFELIKKLNYVLEDVCYPETSVMSQLDELKRRGCPSGEQLLTDLGLCEVSDEKND